MWCVGDGRLKRFTIGSIFNEPKVVATMRTPTITNTLYFNLSSLL